MRSVLGALVMLTAACSSGPSPFGGDAGWVNPDGGVPTGDCQQDHRVIAEQTALLVQQHQGPCSVDSDCALVERSVPCSSFCPEGVLADGGSELRAKIVAYGELVCPHAACVSAGLCPAFDKAICHQGFCARGFNDGGLSP